MTNRKVSVLLLALASSAVAMAQHPAQGTISLIPRVGVSMASLAGEKIYIEAGNMPMSSRYKTGFMGGIDLDYQMLDNLSISLGAYYAQQGCNYRNNSVETKDPGNTVNGTGYSDWSTNLDYLNVPLMLNVYVAPGVAVKAGLQVGFALSGKTKYTTTDYTKTPEGEYKSEKPRDVDIDLDKTLNKVNFSVPVGFSYEFSNVILDARYNIGLTSFQNIDGFESSKNRVFTISAGYRFAL